MDLQHWYKLKDGDRHAFTALFEAWWESLFQYACKVTGSAATAEELVQELFINLWCKREVLPDIQSVKAYLFVSLKNRILNYFSSRKMTVLDIEMAAGMPAPSDASCLVDRKEAERQLYNLANTLPSKTKQVYEMHFIKGFSVSEIAGVTGNSEQTIRNQLNQARKKAIVNLILSIIP